MSLLTALAFAAALSAPADTHDWTALSQLPGMMAGIDTLSISGEGNLKQITAVAVWKEPQAEGMVYSAARWEFDCAGQRGRLLSSQDYGANGEDLGGMDPIDWVAVKPGTINGLFADAACKGQWAQGTPHFAELTDYVAAVQAMLAQ